MTARPTKVCVGCGDTFITYRSYDYCRDCAINGQRYLKKSPCSECNGSGMIKFPNQKPRPCKLCHLTKNPMNKTEKYWDQVDLSSQEKIYQLLTRNIPLPNLKLITEPYRYEDKQEKLTGLFLHKDADYRTLLTDTENQYEGENLPSPESLAEQISLWYCRLVVTALIKDTQNYSCYDSSYFENLTSE